jgi:hypothetical protein
MNKRDIIILIAVMVFLALRLYQKYKKKESNSSTPGNKTTIGSGFPSSIKDDEYEPYSKK